MNIKLLADKFISHSPNFYGDGEIDELDNKHQKIISLAYDVFKNINEDNFRNWDGQSDLSAPAQLSYLSAKKNGFIRELVRFFYHKTFIYNDSKYLTQALLDDYEIIKLSGALNILLDHPVHKTLGAKDLFTFSNTTFTPRWLRYIYLTNKILNFKLNKGNCVWLDVGSYYGGLQSLVKKYRPEWKIILVDFHHQLCRSYIYLNDQFSNSKHIFPDQIKNYKSFQDMPKGCIAYVPASEFSAVSKMEVNLSTNFFSFGEMRRQTFLEYISSKVFKNSNLTYMVNRFVSAPYFEKTYDSDLNVSHYLKIEGDLQYFDIFPIHYYFVNKRYLFSRKFFRNLSSPYFEMVIKK